MLNYAVCEIAGKQYKVIPGKPFDVVVQGNSEKEINSKALLLNEDGKIKIGKPYLKDELTFEVIGQKSKKIRMAKFHAKANYRKVLGSKTIFKKVILPVKNHT